MAKSRRPVDEEDDDRPPRRSRPRNDDDDEAPPRRVKDEGIPPNTPRVYIHKKCGQTTRMPNEVIRTYLDNPFHFGHETECAHCGKAVPWKNCTWKETGENLLTYFEDLQARAILAGNDQREDENGKMMIFVGPIVSMIVFGIAGYHLGAGYWCSARSGRTPRRDFGGAIRLLPLVRRTPGIRANQNGLR